MSVQNSPSATQTLTNAFNGPDRHHVCFSAFPIGLVFSSMRETAKEDDHLATKIFKSIALAIVALISTPLVLIEAFFRALISAFVLMGDAIKNSINGTMEQFKVESAALGESVARSFASVVSVFILVAGPFIKIQEE